MYNSFTTAVIFLLPANWWHIKGYDVHKNENNLIFKINYSTYMYISVIGLCVHRASPLIAWICMKRVCQVLYYSPIGGKGWSCRTCSATGYFSLKKVHIIIHVQTTGCPKTLFLITQTLLSNLVTAPSRVKTKNMAAYRAINHS